MKKWKKHWITGVIVLIVIIVSISVIIALRPSQGETVVISVYHFNPVLNRLEREEYRKSFGHEDLNDEKLLDAAIAAMRETPRNTLLIKTMPDDELFLTGYAIENNVLNASFSTRYYEMSPMEEALFRASFIWTMTELPFIDHVLITVDGNDLTNSRGNAISAESRENVDIDPVISSERLTSRNFILYYVSEDTSGLVSEERAADNVKVDQLEKTIVQLLIDSQAEAGHTATIPSDTKIRDIRTEDGICYVNLSSEFINSKFNGSPAVAKLTIYSIVNSLTENVSNVKRVQFLIESQREDQFQGVTEFNRLFERDDTLLVGYLNEG